MEEENDTMPSDYQPPGVDEDEEEDDDDIFAGIVQW